jgi:hypothetical protein
MKSVQKIEYTCIKKPNLPKLEGFEVKGVYKGRTFNNLYEISVEWASHKPTFLIEKKTFDQFFRLVEKPEMAGTKGQTLEQ